MGDKVDFLTSKQYDQYVYRIRLLLVDPTGQQISIPSRSIISSRSNK